MHVHAPLPLRILKGRPVLFISLAAGLCVWAGLQLFRMSAQLRGLLAWDAGCVLLLATYGVLFWRREGQHIETDAERQRAGEWSVFWGSLAAVFVSFAAIIGQFSALHGADRAVKDSRVALVAVTLLLSWLVTHLLFALRYAHEYYERSGSDGTLARGLQFPDDNEPDYWDFTYFAICLGMTFQVSDVQINSKALRRLALVHSVLAFLFNTVIVALTVNLAAGLL